MTHADPRWGAEDRDRKAANIVDCLELFVDRDLATMSCVDIGCGSGGISYHLAPHFASVCGVDPEPWQRWQEFSTERPNLNFIHESIETLSIEDNSVDVVICNQVYEHVRSPQVLIAQIYRILKPGGICYFAGPNLLFPIEPHVFWPFVHWIPRRWALGLLRIFSPTKVEALDAYSATYWTLKRWLGAFSVVDAVPTIIRRRARAENAHPVWRLFRAFPSSVLKLFAFLSPGFVFLLAKPEDNVEFAGEAGPTKH
ncbi:MAG: class I SAM-dependent methyltransferase [Woeseiaceae bacterium]